MMLGEGEGEGMEVPQLLRVISGVSTEDVRAIAHCPSPTRPPPASVPLHTE